MPPDDKLHPDQKNHLASKFPELDAILKQRQQLQDEIRALYAKAEELHKKDQQLEDRFHRLAITVIPTVTKKLPDQRKSKSEAEVLVANLLKNLELNKPDVQEQVEALLKRFTAGQGETGK